MKLQSIQLLRGFAVSIVVIHHFMSPFYNFKHTNFIGDIFSKYGAFGVDIFFVISGFIMAYIIYNSRNITAKTFILNRIIRIVPNYWFWIIILLIMTLGIGVDTLFVQNATFKSIIQSMLFITHDHPSPHLGFYPVLTVGWTLNIEMFFYVTITLLLFTHIATKRLLLFLIVIFITLPIVWQTFHIPFYKSVLGNIRLIEFSTGIAIAYLWYRHKTIKLTRTSIIFILLVLLTLFIIHIPKLYQWVILSSLLVYVMLSFEDSNILKYPIVRYFSYLGEISFSLYLSHAVTIRSVYYFFGEITSNLDFILAFTICLTISFVLAILSHKFIEIKLSKYLKNKFSRV